jgi:hypothetical protein
LTRRRVREDARAVADSGESSLDLENRTDSVLSVRAARGLRIEISPLGTRRVRAKDVREEDLAAASAAQVLVVHQDGEMVELGGGFVWVPLVVAFVCVVSATSDAATTTTRIAWAAGAVAALLFAVGAVLVMMRRFGAAASALSAIPRRLKEWLYLLVVAAITIAMPGAILWFGSDVPALLDAAADDQQRTTVLIGIAVLFVSIVGASSLPVLLYFVFDREKLKTLREKFVRHIFRLDPSVRTRTDIDVKYGVLLDEAYGRRTQERLLPGARSPILIATGVITIGWTIALLNTNGDALLGVNATMTDLLAPAATVPTYAFLGAYFFSLNLVMRGYVRGDLRPKTYAQVAARIVEVVVLAFVLAQLAAVVGGDTSSPTLLALAFVAGIVPETVLVRLQELARAAARTPPAKRAVGQLTIYETDPLTQLEGIDIYDRARLMDEGVTNVEALAHHDLVELLLKTRIPASRLVDWVDQAILYIHCGGGGDDAVLGVLRRHGIRTATDLQRAYARAVARDGGEAEFLAIADPLVLRVVLDAIADEDWMWSLKHWHAHPAKPRVKKVPESYGSPHDAEPFVPEKDLAAVPLAGVADGDGAVVAGPEVREQEPAGVRGGSG